MTAQVPPVGVAARGSSARTILPAAVHYASGAAAAVLVWLAGGLPLWQARLMAPQYPGGLRMNAYGDRFTGDLAEINSLNHYIGMKSIHLGDVWETVLWKPTIAVAFLAVLLAILPPRRWVRIGALLALWSMPFGILGAIQVRLYQYGHNLDEAAALRVPEFTPLVVGPTKVWNFVTWGLPGSGVISLLLAAAFVTFGPILARRMVKNGGTFLAGLLVVALLLVPTAAQAQLHDHGSGGDDLRATLAAAEAGSTIVLPEGMYHGRFTIERPITLRGAPGAVLHGDGSGTVLTIAAPGTTVEGVTVANTGTGPVGAPAGIKITADEVRIANVKIAEAYIGIAVDSARGVTIEDSSVRGITHSSVGDGSHVAAHDVRSGGAAASYERGDGISILGSSEIMVRNTTIDDVRDGLYLSSSEDVLLDANVVRGSRYALHTMYARHLGFSENLFEGNLSGAVLMYGGEVLALKNTIREHRSESTGFGFLLKDVVGLEAAKNVIVHNRVGVHVEGGEDEDRNRFVLNTIAVNSEGAVLYPTAAITFTGNSFVENVVQVAARGTSSPSKVAWMENGAGNHWSTYRGYDAGGDGLGDVEHREAGRLAALLGDNPVLFVLAGSPAFRLLGAVQDRWLSVEGGIVDQVPLVRGRAPAVAVGSPSPQRWLAFAPFMLLVGSLFLLAYMRRAGLATTGGGAIHA